MAISGLILMMALSNDELVAVRRADQAMALLSASAGNARFARWPGQFA